MKKNYLVTGAAGFIGGAVATRLVTFGHDVTTIDNLSTGKRENVPAGVRFIEGNCQDDHVIDQLGAQQFDAILHFAGQSSGEISFDDPVYDLRSNTESTIRLISYGLANNCARFIFASSMSVYGPVADEPISEELPCNPLSFYAIGKLASEHYMRIYEQHGLMATALRLYTTYGPKQNLDNLRQGMPSIFLAQMLTNDEILVKGSLDRFRDFIYIDDVVKLTLHILHDEKSYGRVYNAGTGIRTTVEMLLRTLKKLCRSDARIIQEGTTPGDQRGIYADINRIQSELGFTPTVLLEEGLANMVAWARNKIK